MRNVMLSKVSGSTLQSGGGRKLMDDNQPQEKGVANEVSVPWWKAPGSR